MKHSLTRDGGLWRVIALEDNPHALVRAGDRGGLVESEGSLSQEGRCWVGEGAVVKGGAAVKDDAVVRDEGTVVEGCSVLSGRATAMRGAHVADSRLDGRALVAGEVVSSRVEGFVFKGARVLRSTIPAGASVSGEGTVVEDCVLPEGAQVQRGHLFRTGQAGVFATPDGEAMTVNRRARHIVTTDGGHWSYPRGAFSAIGLPPEAHRDVREAFAWLRAHGADGLCGAVAAYANGGSR